MAKILVADDEKDLAEVWKAALEDAGHTVSVAHTGLQTVAMLQSEGLRSFNYRYQYA